MNKRKSKPFLTIEEQMKKLRSRGMQVAPEAAGPLMREGYYAIVNGYKKPFLDREASERAGEDRYADGVRFDDLLALYEFDRELREITFRYLIRAEAVARTAVAYCFCAAHAGPSAYLEESSFASESQYRSYMRGGGQLYAQELAKLVDALRIRAERSATGFVAHYRKEYGHVPLWVLCNDLTFGNIEHFFNLMKPRDQTAVCKMVTEATGRMGANRTYGYFDVSEARVGIEVLVKYRNICAHDERLYCARVGGRKNVGYEQMVWYLGRYLTQGDFLDFLSALAVRITGAIRETRQNAAVRQILEELGFSKLVPEIYERFDLRRTSRPS